MVVEPRAGAGDEVGVVVGVAGGVAGELGHDTLRLGGLVWAGGVLGERQRHATSRDGDPREGTEMHDVTPVKK